MWPFANLVRSLGMATITDPCSGERISRFVLFFLSLVFSIMTDIFRHVDSVPVSTDSMSGCDGGIARAALPLTSTLTTECLKVRIRRWNPVLHALRDVSWTVLDENARTANGENGTPKRVVVKDNTGVAGFTTTCASKLLEGLRLPDATIVEQLRKAGYVIFAKAAMTELAGYLTSAKKTFGYGFMNGCAVNPHGDFPCGGSSSGSAVAVAAGFCDVALGSETRGSVVIPALRCGVWGFKGTRGVLSRTGIVPLSTSLDTPGVFARNVEDLEEAYRTMAVYDETDPGAVRVEDLPVRPVPVGTMRLGVLTDPERPWTPDEKRNLERLVAVTKGAVILKAIPFEACETAYRAMASRDIRRGMDAVLGRWGGKNGVPDSFEALYRGYVDHPAWRPQGMDILEAAHAMPDISDEELRNLTRTEIRRAETHVERMLERNNVDLLLLPDFVDWWSISGCPSLVVPTGHATSGRPTSILVGGVAGDETRLFALARLFEKARAEVLGAEA